MPVAALRAIRRSFGRGLPPAARGRAPGSPDFPACAGGPTGPDGGTGLSRCCIVAPTAAKCCAGCSAALRWHAPHPFRLGADAARLPRSLLPCCFRSRPAGKTPPLSPPGRSCRGCCVSMVAHSPPPPSPPGRGSARRKNPDRNAAAQPERRATVRARRLRPRRSALRASEQGAPGSAGRTVRRSANRTVTLYLGGLGPAPTRAAGESARGAPWPPRRARAHKGRCAPSH